MKKLITLMLASIMTLSLASCGKAAEETKEAMITESIEESTVADAAATEDSRIDAKMTDESETFELSTYITEDWQSAYKEILDKYRAERSVQTESLMEGGETDITGYYLVECSGDDIPELIVRTGNCEAAYMERIYSFNGEETVSSEEYGASHSMYYSNPNEAGALKVYGHMGFQAVDSILFNGETVEEKELFSENLDPNDYEDDYTPIKDIVPGAEYLALYPFSTDLPLVEYTGRISTVDYSMKNEEVEKLLYDISTGIADEEIIPVFAEHLRDPLSAMTFTEFLKAGNFSEYAEEDSVIKMSHPADLNKDGQSEMLLNMGESGIIILSRQNGRTYAYAINYFGYGDEISVEDDVIKTSDEYTSPIRIHFNKEEAYHEYVE